RMASITGRLRWSVLGTETAPEFAGVRLSVLTPHGASTFNIGPDGTFSLMGRDGDAFMSIGPLPPGYRLRSLSTGSVDLLASPLRIDATAATSLAIEAVLEYAGGEQ